MKDIRQHMIVRQSSMKLAVELLCNEQRISNNPAVIPVESIKNLTKKLEDFVLELDVEDNRTLDKNTGKVVVEQPKKKTELMI